MYAHAVFLTENNVMKMLPPFQIITRKLRVVAAQKYALYFRFMLRN